jgi:hypothetical protein
MTSLLTIGALVAALGMPTTVTHGAYCGPAKSAAAVQGVFLDLYSHGHNEVEQSDIMAIAVYNPGGFAQVMYQGAGVASDYWVWTRGGWQATAPASVSKAAMAFFNRMQNLRAAGGNECANPHYVASGSG